MRGPGRLGGRKFTTSPQTAGSRRVEFRLPKIVIPAAPEGNFQSVPLDIVQLCTKALVQSQYVATASAVLIMISRLDTSFCAKPTLYYTNVPFINIYLGHPLFQMIHDGWPLNVICMHS